MWPGYLRALGLTYSDLVMHFREEAGSDLGKMLTVFGIIIAVVGLIMLVASDIPWLGKLPGDITYRGKGFTFYFPLATSIL